MRYLLVVLIFTCLINPIISQDEVTINTTRFSTIYFQFNTTKYTDSLEAEKYKKEYEILKMLINSNPNVTLVIHGYQNIKERVNIAEKRAKKVKFDLIKIGVSEEKIIIKKEAPIYVDSSTLDSEMRLTQHVSFEILGNNRY